MDAESIMKWLLLGLFIFEIWFAISSAIYIRTHKQED